MAASRRPGHRVSLSQPSRLVIALLYTLLFLLLGLYLNGRFLPPFGLGGLWFYSALGALLLGEFLIEPFFTRPADVLANSVAIILACAPLSLAGAQISHQSAEDGRLAYVLAAGLLAVIAALAIVFKDDARKFSGVARGANSVVARVGQARWVFTLLLFGAGYAAFANSGAKIAALYLSWFVVFIIAPLEFGWTRLRHHRASVPPAGGARIEQLEDPGIVVARLRSGQTATLGATARLAKSGVHGVVVDTTSLLDPAVVRIAVPLGTTANVGEGIQFLEADESEPIVGFVGEGTTLADLSVDTSPVAAGVGLGEGRLVRAAIGEAGVLFQITGARIDGERTDAGPRDLVRVGARKLGTWDPERTVFEPTDWLPSPGSEVRLLASSEDAAFSPDAIGHVPGTTYGIRIDPDAAVTHNTAILGVLGVGKTHLAWELVRRLLVHGTKVVVLDITGQYSVHLADVCSPTTQAAIENELDSMTSANYANTEVRDGEAGNVSEFRAALHGLLADFVAGDERLLILNPNRFRVSRMEGKPYQKHANYLGTLTMVHVTQMVTESLLELVRDAFTDKARMCVVLEEAHSLIPEWKSTVVDTEGTAVNGTARAVLQGRKYGLGCVVVTQRTANVTKSILNQCNTVFALRTYDATGMGFLENYIGGAHARLLATLPERTAVVFGRASSCNAPIIVRLNEGAAFEAGFWEDNATAVPQTHVPVAPKSAADEGEDSTDDDIPF